ncbi:MAG: DUF4832 domain-containing protein [Paludibacteraceae bacterium]|nr:DUF4832 domain-containing protein [Paludibacteraceae bacterium]
MKHNPSLALWALLLPFCLFACTPINNPQSTIHNPQDSVMDSTLQPFSLSACQPIDRVQPMTGLVLWPSHGSIKKYKDVIALEYSYCLPCRVVTGKVGDAIQYDWTYFENILNDIASRNHQAVIRFRYEYPGNREVDGSTRGATAVPQYIKDLEDYNETYYKCEDGPTYYADWSNTELQWFTKQFYTDFAAKYGNDSRIAFLEVGFGHWSEYHIYGTPLKIGTNFPSKEYQNEFLLHVGSVMPIPWLISIDAADGSYTSIVRTPEVMALDFGNFDDSFMHKGHEKGSGDGYNEQSWNKIGQGTRWQRGPSGGEISYYSSADQRGFLNPAGLYGVTWEEAAAKYHITFMISNDAPGSTYGTTQRFQEAGMAAGYSFTVCACRAGQGRTQLLVTNEGVAPIYRDAYFAIGSTRCAQSLKGLLPGQKVVLELPVELTASEDLHIESDYILPSQTIQFNIAD